MSELLRQAFANGAVPAGYKEIDTVFFKFDKPGDLLAGKLLLKENQKVGSGMGHKYTILEKESNSPVSFLGTTQLDDRMKVIPTGRSIVVYFDHAKPSTTDNRNPMRYFRVFVEDTRKEDIPI